MLRDGAAVAIAGLGLGHKVKATAAGGQATGWPKASIRQLCFHSLLQPNGSNNHVSGGSGMLVPHCLPSVISVLSQQHPEGKGEVCLYLPVYRGKQRLRGGQSGELEPQNKHIYQPLRQGFSLRAD